MEKPWIWPVLSLSAPLLLLTLTFLTNTLPFKKVVIAVLILVAIASNIIVYKLDVIAPVAPTVAHSTPLKVTHKVHTIVGNS
jgi:hypothetical protein